MRNLPPCPTYDVILSLIYDPCLFVWESPCRFRSTYLVGLSKERPILGDHAKAHIHEIQRIS